MMPSASSHPASPLSYSLSSSYSSAPVSSATEITAYPLQFTGRGGEYFRVWIVNVLLTMVTLGLYTPFARRRTAQYFYGHTRVAGSPLEFTGPLRKMIFGFLLLALFYIGFNAAKNAGSHATVIGLMLLAGALAPYLWGSAMRFRLSATRWRGVRLQFSASWGEIYADSWPVLALVLVWITLVIVFSLLIGPSMRGGIPKGGPTAVFMAQAWTLGGLMLVALTLSVLCVIRLSFNYQSLLMLHANIGTQAGRWKPVFGDFVRIWVATVGIFLLSALLIVGMGIAIAASMAWFSSFSSAKNTGLMGILIAGLLGLTSLLALVLAASPARAYREARMFHLVWNNTGVSHIARFKCKLRTGRFVALRIKNTVLSLLTLGLYRPFAKVSEYAMKTQSVTLHIRGGVDQLAGQLVEQQGALGDAMADAMGLDLIG